ncbi:MAG: acyl carrier protein [Peptococcaceae bacterium]|nr:acyl carrier protein [Peptococcaceae bacterium]
MSGQTIKDQVIEFIRKNQNLQDIEITGDNQLVRDLGITSFDLVEMCCQLEEDFGIVVNEEMMMSIVTIDDLVKCLEESH